jgi:uncharacterized protein YkwD
MPIVLVLLGGLVLAGPPDTPRGSEKAEPPLQLSAEEKEVLELTNAERAREKLPPLKPNPVLFRVARAHAANMARQGQMKHVLDGKNPAQRTIGAGYDYGKVGENIALAEGTTDKEVPPAKAIVDGWMHSKVHRENLMDPEYTDIGLGVVRKDTGMDKVEVYYTQLFGRPRKSRPVPPHDDD